MTVTITASCSSSCTASSSHASEIQPGSVEWEIRVNSSLFTVLVTAQPCGHQLPFSLILTQLTQFATTLNAFRTMKNALKTPLRQTHLLTDRSRIEQQCDRTAAQYQHQNEKFVCFCGTVIKQVRLIIPEHLKAAAEQKVATEQPRPEFEESEELEIQSRIEFIAYQRAVVHLQNLQALINHFENIKHMSREDLQQLVRDTLKNTLSITANTPSEIKPISSVPEVPVAELNQEQNLDVLEPEDLEQGTAPLLNYEEESTEEAAWQDRDQDALGFMRMLHAVNHEQRMQAVAGDPSYSLERLGRVIGLSCYTIWCALTIALIVWGISEAEPYENSQTITALNLSSATT